MTPVETIASTVWLQVSDYSQMSHYIIRLQLYRIISEKKKKKKLNECTNNIWIICNCHD